MTRTNGLIIAFPASFLIFLLPLALAPLGLLRLPSILRSLLLALRSWCLLLTLYPSWLLLLLLYCRASLLPLFLYCRASLLPLFLYCRASLLPLFLYCRASLLRRGLVRWLRALVSRSALLARRRTLDILLSWAFHPRLFLPSPLSRCGRSLFFLLLKVLADYRVTRLVTVILAAYRMLLLDLPGIPIS